MHLEVASSLETDDFILPLMRFLHQREHVRELCSNNRLTFVGADREIKEAIDQIDNEKVGRELSQCCYTWVFHPPGASFLINEEVLRTVFTEAE